ncbi:MAG: polyprenol monophosphomannose synthase [Nanobdellota archaeon]
MFSLIIPTYNEEKNIGRLLRELKVVLNKFDYEVIVVDDSSVDNTQKIVSSLIKYMPLRLVKRRKKRDLSLSIIEGFKKARGDVIGVMDADLSHGPLDLKKILKKNQNGYDFVIGSRLIKGGRVQYWPLYRKFISFVATCLIRPITKIKDPLSGFFVFNKEILEGVELNPIGYKIGLELLIKGKYSYVTEVPIIFKNRDKGKSKAGVMNHLKYIFHIIRLYKHKSGVHK